jgi:uncharacterized membrane protein
MSSNDMRTHSEQPRPLDFPKPYAHDHPPVANVNDLFEGKLTFGQRAADRVAKVVGSWKFIIIQTVILAAWAVLNVVAWTQHWDPYPFILMNLFLSLQAAYTAPMLMMSQNRLSARDRLEAHNDFLINQTAEIEIRVILEHLEAQNQALIEIYRSLRSGSADASRL